MSYPKITDAMRATVRAVNGTRYTLEIEAQETSPQILDVQVGDAVEVIPHLDCQPEIGVYHRSDAYYTRLVPVSIMSNLGNATRNKAMRALAKRGFSIESAIEKLSPEGVAAVIEKLAELLDSDLAKAPR
jgi:hypothetical protein